MKIKFLVSCFFYFILTSTYARENIDVTEALNFINTHLGHYEDSSSTPSTKNSVGKYYYFDFDISPLEINSGILSWNEYEKDKRCTGFFCTTYNTSCSYSVEIKKLSNVFYKESNRPSVKIECLEPKCIVTTCKYSNEAGLSLSKDVGTETNINKSRKDKLKNSNYFPIKDSDIGKRLPMAFRDIFDFYGSKISKY